jgi:hypothetical protein
VHFHTTTTITAAAVGAAAATATATTVTNDDDDDDDGTTNIIMAFNVLELGKKCFITMQCNMSIVDWFC